MLYRTDYTILSILKESKKTLSVSEILKAIKHKDDVILTPSSIYTSMKRLRDAGIPINNRKGIGYIYE